MQYTGYYDYNLAPAGPVLSGVVYYDPYADSSRSSRQLIPILPKQRLAQSPLSHDSNVDMVDSRETRLLSPRITKSMRKYKNKVYTQRTEYGLSQRPVTENEMRLIRKNYDNHPQAAFKSTSTINTTYDPQNGEVRKKIRLSEKEIKALSE